MLWTGFCVLSCSVLSAQNVAVSGMVTDAQGAPMAGVSVTVKGQSVGAVTNAGGSYEIKAAPDAVLEFRFIGYVSVEELVGARTNIPVVMKEETTAIDDVVVVGYGVMRKSDLTGAVGTFKLGKTEEGTAANLQQLLGGKIAGVVVNESSGAPGSSLSIEVRGIGSLNYSTQPLYVVDGVPLDMPDMTNVTSSYTGGTTIDNPLSTLNPNDIASIEVLKDASATAIYGSRGSNGVVLITTKSGQEGRTKISFTYSHTLSDLMLDYDMLDSYNFAQMANLFREIREYTPEAYTAEEMANLKTYNHLDAIKRLGQTVDASLSVSGGDARSKYYVSGQYLKQEGAVINTDLERFSGKINYERELFRRLKLTTNISASRTIQNGANVSGWGGGYLNSVLAWVPSVPLYNPDGTYNVLNSYMFGTEATMETTDYGKLYIKERFRDNISNTLSEMATQGYYNPLQYLEEFVNTTTANNLSGIVGLRYAPSANWVINGKASASLYNSLTETYRPTGIPVPGASWRGMAYLGNTQNIKTLGELTASFNYKLRRHYLNGVVGATAERYEQKVQTASTQGFTNDFTGPYLIEAGTILQAPTSLVTNYSLVSLLARLNYHYNYKYYLTFSARYDGSSKFAKGNRFGFFPSAALSWRVNKERFMQSLTFISDLKLRASIGVVGNQAISSYNTLSLLGSGDKDADNKYNYAFGGVVNSGYAPRVFTNRDLQWERTVSVNLGADLSLFDKRLNFVLDLYKKYTDNLLYNVNIPLTTGFATMVANVGSLENEGLEVTLNAVPVVTRDFSWTLDFNIGFNRNKVTKLSGQEAPGYYYELGTVNQQSGITRLQVGKPIGLLYGYESLPVWNYASILTKPATFQATAEEGDRRYKDQDNNGLLNEADMICMGSALPDFSGGFAMAFRYKNLDLSMNFSYSYGNMAYNAFEVQFYYLTGNTNTFRSVYENRYVPLTADMTQEQKVAQAKINMTTHINKVGASASDPRVLSTLNVYDASFIRCKDITLGYTLPAKWTSRWGIGSVKFFATLGNPFIFTNYPGNPEAATSTGLIRGVDNGSYPLSRMYKFGISINY